MVQNCDCKTEIAIIKTRLDNSEKREEVFIKNIERWQEQQDKRLDRLDEADDSFQRDINSSDKNRFTLWVTVAVTIAATVLGSVLTLLFSKL